MKNNKSNNEKNLEKNLGNHIINLRELVKNTDEGMKYEKNKINILLLILSLVANILPAIQLNTNLIVLYIFILLTSMSYLLLKPIKYAQLSQIYNEKDLERETIEIQRAEYKYLKDTINQNSKNLKDYQINFKYIVIINIFSLVAIYIINIHI